MPGVKNKSGGKRPGAGRLAFKSNEEQRKLAMQLAAFGLRHSDICLLIKDPKGKSICEPTLRKHFSMELGIGKSKAIAKVAETLYKKAIGGDTTSIIFFLKSQAGWTDRQHVELTGANGGPMQSITTVTSDPVEAAKIYQQMMNL